jgi:hypothetical protein
MIIAGKLIHFSTLLTKEKRSKKEKYCCWLLKIRKD